MPLDADAEPIRLNGFYGFDDAVRGAGRHPQPRADRAHCLVMIAVDADFTATVDFLEAGIRFEQDRVAMRRARWVAMRHGARLIFWQVQKQRPATGHVELLHA